MERLPSAGKCNTPKKEQGSEGYSRDPGSGNACQAREVVALQNNLTDWSVGIGKILTVIFFSLQICFLVHSSFKFYFKFILSVFISLLHSSADKPIKMTVNIFSMKCSLWKDFFVFQSDCGNSCQMFLYGNCMIVNIMSICCNNQRRSLFKSYYIIII